MKKKIFWIIGGLAILAAAVAIYFLLLQRKNTGALYAIPDNAMAVCAFENVQAVTTAWDASPTEKALQALPVWSSLRIQLEFLLGASGLEPDLDKDIADNTLIAALYAGGNNALDWLFVVPLNRASGFHVSDLVNEVVQMNEHTFEHEQIYEFSSDTTLFACAKVHGLFLFSSSSVLVENAVLHVKKQPSLDTDPAFHKVHSAMDENVPFYVMLNYPVCVEYMASVCKPDLYAWVTGIKPFTDWIGFTLDFTDEGIAMNGFTAASADKHIQDLQGNYAYEMPDIIPANTVYLDRIRSSEFTVQTAKAFPDEESNRAFFDRWAPWLGERMLVGMTEPLDPDFQRNMFVVFPVNDEKLVYDKLSAYAVNDSLVKENSVWKMYGGNILRTISKVPFPDTMFAGMVDTFLVFAPDGGIIEEMQQQSMEHTFTGKQGSYSQFKQFVSSNFNRSWYFDLGHATQLFNYLLPDNKKQATYFTDHFGKLELQFSNNGDIFLFNGFLQYTESAQRTSGMIWKQSLERPARNGPYVVYNAERKQMYIALQDTANQLLMYSANGSLQWKQFLPGKVMGEMHEVDFYGNGSTQILFNTSDAIYLMDFNGNMVEGFPITLTALATAPVCVDNMGSGKYAIYIPCSNDNIYGFSSDGRPLNGWNPFKGSGMVQLPVQVSVHNGDKNIGYVSGGTLHVVKQNGKPVKQISFGEPVLSAMTDLPMSLYLGVSGAVYSVDASWNMGVIPPFPADLHPTFADVDGNGEPDILYADGNYIKAVRTNGETIFVADVTDTTATAVAQRVYDVFGYGAVTDDGKLYLLDENGKIRDGFPRAGSALFKMCDLTMHGDKIAVVIDGSTLYAYRLK